MKSMPVREPIPAWYELSCRDAGKSISLEVHPLALEQMQKVDWNDAPGPKYIGKEYDLQSFTPPHKGACGFQEVLIPIEPHNKEWIAWNIRLPILRPAPGENPSAEKYMIAVRATLNLFSTCLWLFEGTTDHPKNQLIVIEGIYLPEKDRWMYNGSLGATLTPDAVAWIAEQPETENVGPLVEAMRNAYQHMWQDDHGLNRFRAPLRKPKWIHLDIPGNACGLDPEDQHDPSLGRGYQLVPHNTDTGLQQLTLLAGLSKLHDMMRGR